MVTTKSNNRSEAVTADGRSVVTDLYDALNERDPGRTLDLFAEDVTWSVPDSLPAGGTYRGRMAVGAYLVMLGETWHTLDLHPERFVGPGEGGEFAVTGQTTMTNTVTGEKDRVPFAHIVTVQDGKIAALDEFTDTARVTKLIGNPIAARARSAY